MPAGLPAPSPRSVPGRVRRIVAVALAAVVSAGVCAGTASASSGSSSSSLGTAYASVADLNLHVKLLSPLTPLLRSGVDLPVDIPVEPAYAPAGTAPTNYSESAIRIRDGLLGLLGLPANDSSDLVKGDVVSSTARAVGTYAQGYATLTNARIFVPLLDLPGSTAANGALKLDAVSSFATCIPGQAPTADVNLPLKLTVLGRQIPVVLGTDILVRLGLVNVDVRIGKQVTTSASGASAGLSIHVDANVAGIAQVSGEVTVAQTSCTTPQSAAAGTSRPSGGAGSGSQGAAIPGRGGGTGSAAPAGSVPAAGGARSAGAAGSASSAPSGSGAASSSQEAASTATLARTGTSSAAAWYILSAALGSVFIGMLAFRLRRRLAPFRHR